MKSKSIRGKAIVILQRNKQYLFTVCFEESTGRIFYIPVGGGIEFGEYAIDAAKREALEEIGQEIEIVQLLDISENIFEYNGAAEHEIVFIFKAEFKDKAAYDMELVGNKNDDSRQLKLTWASVDEVNANGISVYPSSLLKIIMEQYEK